MADYKARLLDAFDEIAHLGSEDGSTTRLAKFGLEVMLAKYDWMKNAIKLESFDMLESQDGVLRLIMTEPSDMHFSAINVENETCQHKHPDAVFPEGLNHHSGTCSSKLSDIKEHTFYFLHLPKCYDWAFGDTLWLGFCDPIGEHDYGVFLARETTNAYGESELTCMPRGTPVAAKVYFGCPFDVLFELDQYIEHTGQKHLHEIIPRCSVSVLFLKLIFSEFELQLPFHEWKPLDQMIIRDALARVGKYEELYREDKAENQNILKAYEEIGNTPTDHCIRSGYEHILSQAPSIRFAEKHILGPGDDYLRLGNAVYTHEYGEVPIYVAFNRAKDSEGYRRSHFGVYGRTPDGVFYEIELPRLEGQSDVSAPTTDGETNSIRSIDVPDDYKFILAIPAHLDGTLITVEGLAEEEFNSFLVLFEFYTLGVSSTRTSPITLRLPFDTKKELFRKMCKRAGELIRACDPAGLQNE